MKQYDVTCPACGCLNERLYLEETAGAFECRKCLHVTYLSTGDADPRKIFDIEKFLEHRAKVRLDDEYEVIDAG